MPTITPTIGRKVWFWHGDPTLVERLIFGAAPLDPLQAFDATVVFVNPDGTVNLEVVTHTGHHEFVRDVQLRDPVDASIVGNVPDQHGGTENYATWMPYQVGQARATQGAAATPSTLNTQQQAPAVGSDPVVGDSDAGSATAGDTAGGEQQSTTVQ